ncbi:hypothetical protein D3C71_2104020 [compost metagenome]
MIKHQRWLSDQIERVGHADDAGTANGARDRRRLGQALAKRGQLRLFVRIEVALLDVAVKGHAPEVII